MSDRIYRSLYSCGAEAEDGGSTGFHFSQGKRMVQLKPTQHFPLELDTSQL